MHGYKRTGEVRRINQQVIAIYMLVKDNCKRSPILDGLVVMISACHSISAGDLGSIPSRGDF